MTSSTVTDEGLARLRERLGLVYAGGPALVDVHEDDIRRFCDGIGDSNPLYLDRQYGERSPFGSIIAPPGYFDIFLHHTGSAVGGLRGAHAFAGGADWEFFSPIRPGDVLNVSYRPSRVDEREGKFAGRSAIVDADCLYRNQLGKIVVRAHGHVFRVDRSQGRERQKYSPRKPAPYSREELEKIWSDYDREQRRGDVPRYWEDVLEGEHLPRAVKGPLRVSEIAFLSKGLRPGIGASTTGSHYYQFASYRKQPGFAEVNPETGVEDHPWRGHWEAAMAASIGVPGVYDLGMQRATWLAQSVANWIGDHGWLRRFYCEYRMFNLVGDTTWISGNVSRKWLDGDNYFAQVELKGTNQRGEATCTGWAIVALPSRFGKAITPQLEAAL